MRARSANRFVFINAAIWILAVTALGLLWSSPHSLLWWEIFLLLVLHVFVSKTVNMSKRINAKVFVVRFWSNVRIVVDTTCMGLSSLAIAVTLLGRN